MNTKDNKCPHCGEEQGSIGIYGWVEHFRCCRGILPAIESGTVRPFTIYIGNEGYKYINQAMKEAFIREQEWREGNGY